MKGWRKRYHGNINQRKAVEGTLISDKADFRTRKIVRVTEGSISLGRHRNP